MDTGGPLSLWPPPLLYRRGCEVSTLLEVTHLAVAMVGLHPDLHATCTPRVGGEPFAPALEDLACAWSGARVSSAHEKATSG